MAYKISSIIMKWFLTVVKNYAKFTGRARRKEFWMFTLFFYIFYIAAFLIDSLTGLLEVSMGMGVVSLVFSLALFIPALAVSVRRLHDSGKSGWMLLINLIPLIGQIWFLVLLLADSKEDNQYGANPKK